VLLLGVFLGLVAGLLAGGRLDNLVAVRLRWIGLFFLAFALRIGTEAALARGIPLAESLRLPLLLGAYGLLLIALYRNRHYPGLLIALVGILANATAILVNGGHMPIWEPSLRAAGLGPTDVTSSLHVILPAPLDSGFLAHAGFLGDVIPIPFPFLTNVASLGDLFLAGGFAFFLFATLVRVRPEEAAAADAAQDAARAARERLAAALGLALPEAPVTLADVPMETGLTASLAEAAALERPMVLGGSTIGLASPASSTIGATGGTARRAPLVPALVERARHHPYARLAVNSSFSAMWFGQLISLFGDRLHQIALAFLMLEATGSPFAVGLVFVAATIPNLLLGPIAGTFVDRWDHREVMVVSDLLRAAAVLFVPIAAVTNIALVYPLVFLVTSISIFFRPARTAVVPRIVAEDELLTANSATWVGETLADVIGYPLAGLFVGFLGEALPLAFWFDAATYVASALLIATMAIPAVKRIAAERAGDEEDAAAPQPATTAGAIREFRDELVAGWRFMRGETVLLANTLQATVGQFTAGVLLALAPFYAHDVIERGSIDATSAYAFLETGIGVGNLVGGFIIGLVGARLARGRLVIAGYVLLGICMTLLAVAGSLPLAFGLMFGSGVANMVYVIPSQTLFQERTPQELMGRVVGFRFALVFGSMTLAMGVSGLLAQQFGVAAVIAFFGVVTIGAGLAGLLVPAVRNA